MQKLSCGDAAMYDPRGEGGVFGMAEAKLLSRERAAAAVEQAYRDAHPSAESYVFACGCALKPAALSVLDPHETRTDFHVAVEKQGEDWRVASFFNG